MGLITQQIAEHLRDIHFGGNWTTSCLRDQVKELTWEQATQKVQSFNTIATLVYHAHYYVHEVIPVLNGAPLTASDKLSFDHPPITCQSDWDNFLNNVWLDAETFAGLIEQLPDDCLHQPFTDEKYGTYYRNLAGIIEHMHYHLGQIVIIRKLL